MLQEISQRHTPATRLSVTVAISTRNRGRLIEETLAKLLTLDYPQLEILIVDQSTNPETRDAVTAVCKGDPRINFLPSTSVGLPAGRNIAIAASRSDIIAYTDDDCIVSDEWLAGLLAEFEDQAVAAVFGRLLPWEYGRRTGIETGYKPGTERVVYEGMTPPWWVGHGGNMAFRRSTLQAIGGFDPLLGAGAPLKSGEDSDVIFRLLRLGKRVVYSPVALAYHKHWKDWKAQQSMERAYAIGAGAEFGKFMRCGDPAGFKFFAQWVWQLGVRRIGAGMLKWRNPKVVYLGYCELVYPWIGLRRSLTYSIDRSRMLYMANRP